MSILDVPGARLYYETHGSGPLLLHAPWSRWPSRSLQKGDGSSGGGADHRGFIYDRRGFSRSQLDGPQDAAHRLATDAADVRRLIEHVSDQPAIVFGTSSGGIVVLEVLTRHPSVVRTLVLFEPAAMRRSPDGQRWVGFFCEVMTSTANRGMAPVLTKFREHTFPESDRQLMARMMDLTNGDIRANATSWFERELRQYPAVDLDLDMLKTHAERIVPAAGRASRGYPCYESTVAPGKKLGRDMLELPGGHTGYGALILPSSPTSWCRPLRTGQGSEGVIFSTRNITTTWQYIPVYRLTHPFPSPPCGWCGGRTRLSGSIVLRKHLEAALSGLHPASLGYTQHWYRIYR